MALPGRGYVDGVSIGGGVIERGALIVMAVFFMMSLIDGNPILMFHTAWGLGLATYLFASARQRSSARR